MVSPPVTPLSGMHHVTAVSGDPRRNIAFYTGVLGLRLIKRTVNFDAPDIYHLYYGDAAGRPGTILTFFVRLDGAIGRRGGGQATTVRFAVPAGALDEWGARLESAGVEIRREPVWCGSPAIEFDDPEGLRIQLVGDRRQAASSKLLAVGALHSVELTVADAGPTHTFLNGVMGLTESRAAGPRCRFAGVGAEAGGFVDVYVDPAAADGVVGPGCVHHVAFRTHDDESQFAWQRRVREAGGEVTDVRDRKYFRSIYFHEPGGVRLEIATDGPGFAVDEAPGELGRVLQLPAELEPARPLLESRLG